MAESACPAGSSVCSNTRNTIISDKVTVPLSNQTGLAVVNVDDDQNWKVFYHDKNSMVSQLAGNSSGFDQGQIIGGRALEGSSLAATNINSKTNNINVFYVDGLSSDLYTFQFTDDEWVIRE
jgi:hypothetical protein